MSMLGQRLKCNIFDNLSEKRNFFFKYKHHFVSGVEAAEREHNHPSQLDERLDKSDVTYEKHILYHNEYNNIEDHAERLEHLGYWMNDS